MVARKKIKKDSHFMLRLDKFRLLVLKQLAEREGVTASELVRRCIDKQIIEEGKSQYENIKRDRKPREVPSRSPKPDESGVKGSIEPIL